MIDVCVDIARYLNAAEADFPELKMYSDGDPTVANLYIYQMPPSPDFAVSILRYEGTDPTETFGNPVAIRHPRIQIMVRDLDSFTALNFAERIMKFLTVVKNQNVNGNFYQRIKPVGEPFEIGPDSSNRARAVINFTVSFNDSVGS